MARWEGKPPAQGRTTGKQWRAGPGSKRRGIQPEWGAGSSQRRGAGQAGAGGCLERWPPGTGGPVPAEVSPTGS